MRTEGHGWEWQTPSAKHAKSWYTLRVSTPTKSKYQANYKQVSAVTLCCGNDRKNLAPNPRFLPTLSFATCLF